MYLFPIRDVTGNSPVKSVYTVPVVSADRNAMKTSSVLISGVGSMSFWFASSRDVCLVWMLRVFLRFLSRWPFEVAADVCKCLATPVLLIPGQVTK